MNELVKITVIGICAVLCCAVLRKQAAELAVALTLTASALILWTVFSSLEYITAFLSDLAEYTGIPGGVFGPVLKVTGIAVITRISSAICKDAGESGLASMIDFAGTVCALVVTIPLAETVLQTVSELM